MDPAREGRSFVMFLAHLSDFSERMSQVANTVVRSALGEQASGQQVQPDAEACPWLISSWEVCANLLQSLRIMILGSWTWREILAHLDQLTRLLTRSPQKRGHQESQILEQLTRLLSTFQS